MDRDNDAGRGASRAADRTLAAMMCAAFMLSSCASTNTVLAHEADEVFHSPHSADEVASCFAQRDHIRIMERADGAKVARFTNGYGVVVRTFSIYPEGAGSRIERRNSAIGALGVKWQRCVGVKPWQPLR